MVSFTNTKQQRRHISGEQHFRPRATNQLIKPKVDLKSMTARPMSDEYQNS